MWVAVGNFFNTAAAIIASINASKTISKAEL